MPEQTQTEMYRLAFEQSLDDAIETADEYLSRADQIEVLEEKLLRLRAGEIVAGRMPAGGLNG